MNYRNKTCAWCLVFSGLLVLSCGGQSDPSKSRAEDDPVALALAVAQEYVDGYFEQFPEDAVL